MNKPIFLKTLKQQINCINTEYSNNQIVLSVLTGFIFFVFPASLFITLAVNLIIIYFFYFEIIYAFLFLILFGLALLIGYLKNPAFGNCSHIEISETNSKNSPSIPILSINPPLTISQ